MSNPWDHLPNAKYIDAVIASVEAHPAEWAMVWMPSGSVLNAAYDTAYKTVSETQKSIIWYKVTDAVWVAAQKAARPIDSDRITYTSRDALLALITYDDCGHMLESEPGELEILARFGDQKALLLLSSCKAFAAIKGKENV